ncbi:MAG: AAA family ATPase [Zetaproteobacteria bacterium]|nr:AAA family ATPase [Zetaproteobacteria bacterium]
MVDAPSMPLTLLGHENSLQRFVAEQQAGHLHHAWILHGLQGIGKATLAKMMATAYLCEAMGREDSQACGVCHSCKMVAMDAHPDLLSLYRPVDKRDLTIAQVRDALSFLHYSGSNSERRVVILDDADSLNNQAANALLKGLEEPSRGAILLMVCHDLAKLPATIRSRCMLEACAPLLPQSMAQALAQLRIPEAYQALALQLADGRPGMVVCMQDEAVSQAISDWQAIVANPEKMNIGHLQDWMSTHLKSKQIPYHLIVQVVWNALQARGENFYAGQSTSWHDQAALLAAIEAIMQWPSALHRHTLRPEASLFTLMLQLREAAKRVV